MAKHEGKLFDQIKQHFGTMVQGDLTSTLALLTNVDPSTLDEKDTRVKEDYEARFLRFSPPKLAEEAPALVELLSIYQQYWFNLLTGAKDKDAADELLQPKVRAWCRTHGQAHTDIANLEEDYDKVEELVKDILAPLGYHALLGTVLPYRELIVWKQQTEKYYSVILHDDQSEVKLLFLDDFISFGWLGYASFDVTRVGGWAKDDMIVQTNPEPEDTEDESFSVDILAHEGRHHSDYARFPQLKQPGLEYRAKLTELTIATESLQHRLEHFVKHGKPDASAPHSLAAYHLVRDLSQEVFNETFVEDFARWQALEHETIRQAARAVLDRSTAMLNRDYDPQSVTHWFPEETYEE